MLTRSPRRSSRGSRHSPGTTADVRVPRVRPPEEADRGAPYPVRARGERRPAGGRLGTHVRDPATPSAGRRRLVHRGPVAVVLDAQPHGRGRDEQPGRPPSRRVRGGRRCPARAARRGTPLAPPRAAGARRRDRGSADLRRRRTTAIAVHEDLDADIGAILGPLRQPLDRGQEPHLLEDDRPACHEQRLHLVHRRPQVRSQALHGAAALGLGERPAQRGQHLGVQVRGEAPALGSRRPRARPASRPGTSSSRNTRIAVNAVPRRRTPGFRRGPAASSRRAAIARPRHRRPDVPDEPDRGQRPDHRQPQPLRARRPARRPSCARRSSPMRYDAQDPRRDPREHEHRPRPAPVRRRVRRRDDRRHDEGDRHERAQHRAPAASPVTARTSRTSPTDASAGRRGPDDERDPRERRRPGVRQRDQRQAPERPQVRDPVRGVGRRGTERVEHPEHEGAGDQHRRRGAPRAGADRATGEPASPRITAAPSPPPTLRAARAPRARSGTGRRSGRTAVAGGSRPSSRVTPSRAPISSFDAPAAHERQHLDLAIGRTARRGADRAQHRGRERGAARGDRPDRVEHLGDLARLEQVPGGAPLEGRADERRLVERGEEEDRRAVRADRVEQPEALGLAGELDVGHQHVARRPRPDRSRAPAPSSSERAVPASSRSGAAAHGRADRVEDRGMVVDEHDPDRLVIHARSLLRRGRRGEGPSAGSRANAALRESPATVPAPGILDAGGPRGDGRRETERRQAGTDRAPVAAAARRPRRPRPPATPPAPQPGSPRIGAPPPPPTVGWTLPPAWPPGAAVRPRPSTSSRIVGRTFDTLGREWSLFLALAIPAGLGGIASAVFTQSIQAILRDPAAAAADQAPTILAQLGIAVLSGVTTLATIVATDRLWRGRAVGLGEALRGGVALVPRALGLLLLALAFILLFSFLLVLSLMLIGILGPAGAFVGILAVIVLVVVAFWVSARLSRAAAGARARARAGARRHRPDLAAHEGQRARAVRHRAGDRDLRAAALLGRHAVQHVRGRPARRGHRPGPGHDGHRPPVGDLDRPRVGRAHRQPARRFGGHDDGPRADDRHPARSWASGWSCCLSAERSARVARPSSTACTRRSDAARRRKAVPYGRRMRMSSTPASTRLPFAAVGRLDDQPDALPRPRRRARGSSYDQTASSSCGAPRSWNTTVGVPSSASTIIRSVSSVVDAALCAR